MFIIYILIDLNSDRINKLLEKINYPEILLILELEKDVLSFEEKLDNYYNCIIIYLLIYFIIFGKIEINGFFYFFSKFIRKI
jgi:hypothetical protein